MSGIPLRVRAPLHAENGGLFVSDGTGTHPDRVIGSFELLFVRSGTLWLEEAGAEHEVGRGESLLLEPHRRHRGTKPYEPGLSFYWVHFRLRRGRAAGSASTPGLTLPRHASPPRPDRLAELFHRFLDDQESDRLTPLSAASLVALMLDEVGAAPPRPVSAASNVLAARAEAYIASHLHEPLGAADVAAALAVNPDYLNRAFRRVRGHTITEQIHRRRLREVRGLLRETTLPMKQIAARCGFRDPAYLRRLFTRYEGLSPSRFRKLYARLHVNVR